MSLEVPSESEVIWAGERLSSSLELLEMARQSFNSLDPVARRQVKASVAFQLKVAIQSATALHSYLTGGLHK